MRERTVTFGRRRRPPGRCRWPRCRRDGVLTYHGLELCDWHLDRPADQLHERLRLAPVEGCACRSCAQIPLPAIPP